VVVPETQLAEKGKMMRVPALLLAVMVATGAPAVAVSAQEAKKGEFVPVVTDIENDSVTLPA